MAGLLRWRYSALDDVLHGLRRDFVSIDKTESCEPGPRRHVLLLAFRLVAVEHRYRLQLCVELLKPCGLCDIVFAARAIAEAANAGGVGCFRHDDVVDGGGVGVRVG